MSAISPTNGARLISLAEIGVEVGEKAFLYAMTNRQTPIANLLVTNVDEKGQNITLSNSRVYHYDGNRTWIDTTGVEFVISFDEEEPVEFKKKPRASEKESTKNMKRRKVVKEDADLEPLGPE